MGQARDTGTQDGAQPPCGPTLRGDGDAETQRAERGLRQHRHGRRAQAHPGHSLELQVRQRRPEHVPHTELLLTNQGPWASRADPARPLLRESPPWASGFLVTVAQPGPLRLEWAEDTGLDRRGRNAAGWALRHRFSHRITKTYSLHRASTECSQSTGLMFVAQKGFRDNRVNRIPQVKER